MAISQSKYVDILSGVGGQAAAANKELILRVFTKNPLTVAGQAAEYENAAAVGAFYGTESDEYKIAAAYFAYQSRRNTSPKKISFWLDDRGGGEIPYSGQLVSSVAVDSLANFQAITDGCFTLQMNDTSAVISGLDFSSALNYKDVESVITTAFSNTGIPGINSAVCFINEDGSNSGIINGEAGIEGSISVSDPNGQETVGTYIGSMLGLDASQNPDYIPGGIIDAGGPGIAEVLESSFNASNNFGSFKFLDETNPSEMALAAEWNNNKNVQAMFLLSCTASNYESLQAALSAFNGTALIYQAEQNNLDWVLPAAIMASTDYSKPNAAPNYMYKQLSSLTPSVNTDTLYTALTGLNINFYGATQQTGREIAFFQPGTLQGSITDMGVYANEIWLKDALATTFLNHQLAVDKWPANLQGEAVGEALASNVIEQAIYNGTISLGKTLTANQKIYVANITGDSEAWRTLQDKGYIYIGKMISTLVNGTEVWKYEYTLIYCKGDSVRKVEGYHTLI